MIIITSTLMALNKSSLMFLFLYILNFARSCFHTAVKARSHSFLRFISQRPLRLTGMEQSGIPTTATTARERERETREMRLIGADTSSLSQGRSPMAAFTAHYGPKNNDYAHYRVSLRFFFLLQIGFGAKIRTKR